MPVDSDMEKFSTLVRAIEPMLDHVVVIGGWAHRLYGFHPHAQALKHAPLMTLDADLAIPDRLPASEEDIGKRLLDAGFREELFGDYTPPVAHYTLGEQQGGFYAEFLVPLTGGRYKRGGKPDATVRIAGVTAQKLHYLELLLIAPWSVKVQPSGSEVRIANPASYLAQKILIHDQREAADRAKDILYIHDTIEVFSASLLEIHTDWTEKVIPRLRTSVLRDVIKTATQLFGKVNDDVRNAAEIARSLGRALSPERLLEVCQVGLAEVFGDDPWMART